MIEKISTVEFEKSEVTPRLAMEAVKLRGACAIHNFAKVEELQEAAELLRSQRMIIDKDLTGRVPRLQRMGAFAVGDENTPAALSELTAGVSGYVNRGDFTWTPNEIITHRYEANDFIGKHRDYTEAYGLVAVLTLDGLQDFFVILDGDEEATKVTMKPGTLTMLRGFTGDPEKRPYHWVGRPAAQRTALSIRDMRNVWTPKADEEGNWG